jgi:hypothetical protein
MVTALEGSREGRWPFVRLARVFAKMVDTTFS